VLAEGAGPEHDPVLGLTAAAAAAKAGLPLSAGACARVARSAHLLPEPWPDEARHQFTRLLGSGVGLLDVWEALDQAGVFEHWFPEWDRVRMLPPQNAVHRFTVDRHSLEACVQAGELAGSVRRPDLLAVAALLHDLGKGQDGIGQGTAREGIGGDEGGQRGSDAIGADAHTDHASMPADEAAIDRAAGDYAGTDHCGRGAPIAYRIARRWGFDEADAATIRLLVALHLDLPVTATTRDIADPVTISGLVDRIGDRDTLDLLHALAIADARATGPHACSSWRLTLIATLADAVRASFTAGHPTAIPRHRVDLPALHAGVGLSVDVVDGTESLVIAVPDTVGALSVVSGVLSLEGFGIVRALAYPYQPYGGDEGTHVGLSEWIVTGADGIDPVRLRERIAVALADGGARVNERLARRDGTAADAVGGRQPTRDRVVVVPDASATATVLEIRAADRPGLLHRVSRELAARRLDVRSAHAATHGAGVVDVFYVTAADGRPLPPDRADRVAGELTAVLRGEAAPTA
jgi:[protein-PII] uridylyltransferase